MQKIPSLFVRDFKNNPRLVTREVTPGCEWVIDGEGKPTRKWDGTACLVRDGKLFKRYDAKHGKTPPEGFEPAQEPDEKTGHWPGWLPVGDGPEDKYHREAFAHQQTFSDGTYELIGPKIQGNPEASPVHQLIRHGQGEGPDFPRTFDTIQFTLSGLNIEGIVWHHPDGRMCKIKKSDFGLTRKPEVDHEKEKSS